MPQRKNTDPAAPRHLPTMTRDYSRISDTARAVDAKILPVLMSHIASITPRIAAMGAGAPFVIADYGAADGMNSSELFEAIIGRIAAVNPSLRFTLVYIDIADAACFETFWSTAKLARMENVEARYIRRSFYQPFPELAGKLHIGFSSTSLHWLDTATAGADFFRHPTCIQANQLPAAEKKRFIDKWRRDWRVFFRESAAALVEGGALFLANLADLGADRWPASAGYNHLRDIRNALYREGHISAEELNAIFVPDYFATPAEMDALLKEDALSRDFLLRTRDAMTVPCAYFTQSQDKLDTPRERKQLAATLAHVVRAWSESSIRVGLSPDNKGLIEEIYRRLMDAFLESPTGLPYQYCLIELTRRSPISR